MIGQAQDPGTSPSGPVTAKICMTSHSAEDKAHWFLPDREVEGWGEERRW